MKFERSQWCEEAAEKILPLVYDRLQSGFIASVNKGVFALWRVGGQDFETWLVTSMNYLDGGEVELRVECIAGKKSREIMAELMQRSKILGVNSIRFESHHSEKIVKRMAEPLGFERVAAIYRVDI